MRGVLPVLGLDYIDAPHQHLSCVSVIGYGPGPPLTPISIAPVKLIEHHTSR